MKRLSILVVALLVGAAAPARAWCEATCLGAGAPVGIGEAALPFARIDAERPVVVGGRHADCPAIESARPVLAKLEFRGRGDRSSLRTHRAPRHPRTVAPLHPCTPAPLHLIDTPLRL